jgi:hypothetical protein
VNLETDSTEQRGGTQAGETAPGAGEERGRAGEGQGRDDSTYDGFNALKQPWFVVACLLLVASAAFLLLSHPDAAFVCAALGVSAWFWNVRGQLKRKYKLKRRGGRNWEARGDDED